jgi:hypothetical protein
VQVYNPATGQKAPDTGRLFHGDQPDPGHGEKPGAA